MEQSPSTKKRQISIQTSLNFGSVKKIKKEDGPAAANSTLEDIVALEINSNTDGDENTRAPPVLNNQDSVLQTVLLDVSKSKHDEPQRPILESFPMNKNNRRFSSVYYKEHGWIEYSVREESVYCYACRHFAGISLFRGEKEGKRTFIEVGFNKWKDMKALFHQHSESARHKSSMLSWTEWKAISSQQQPSIATRISTTRSMEIQENRSHVKALLRVTSVLGRQGLAFRGHDDGDESENKGNFVEFMEAFSELVR